MQKVKELLFSDKKSVKTKLMNFVMLTSLVGSFVMLIADLIGKFDMMTNYLILAIVITSLLSLWLANSRNHTNLACIIICVVINALIFPSMFFLNGGISGGVVIWMSMGLVLSWFLLNRMTATISFFVFLIIDCIAVWLGEAYPQLITPLTYNQRVMDVLISMIGSGIMISAIIWYGNYLGDAQNREIERKNEEIKRILNEATAAYQDKNEFFSNISHDIRTPLAAIVGFSEIAKLTPDNLERVNLYMDKIHSASIHLMGLVDKIIDLDQIESGRIVIDENEADLVSVFSELKDMVAADISEKNISLSIDTKRVFCKDVLLDTAKFDQCLLAVIDNSIKFTKPNGHIDINVHQKKCDSDKLINTIVRIKDDGIGMSKQFVGHLFDAFSKENKASDVGAGLGLTITKRIVDRMGGNISVDSELGVGTEITIEIPLRIQTDLRKDKAKIQLEGFKDRHVLLAEDNRFNAEMIEDILEGMGARVEIAEDGAVCVDKFREAPQGFYDIVFMDIQMPYKDGYTATRDIRSMDNLCAKTVPIVAITANAYDDDKLKAVESGMNFYITKPVDVKELTEVMKVQFRIYDDWRTENGIRFAAQKTLPSGK